MFKYSCYIENTREAIEWLKKLGYTQMCVTSFHQYIETRNPNYLKISIFSGIHEWDELYSSERIYCRGNLPLFKALTAVRDDSDYMQYFTDGEDWYLCEADNFYEWAFMNKIPVYKCTHKASKEELIEKFKK